MKYIKKPIPIEAIQWMGDNVEEILKFMSNNRPLFNELNEIIIRTPEGKMTAPVGSYIIKDIDNQFYPCRKKVFENLYTKIYEHNVTCRQCNKNFVSLNTNIFYDELNKKYKYWDICPYCNTNNEWEV